LGKCVKALERAGFETYGIEPSEPFRQRALSMMGISPEQLQLARLEDAKFPGNSFDFITFGAVLEHLYDPSTSIAQALQWAKPGGLVHIEVPSSKWLTNRISNFVYAIQGLDYVSNISPMHNPFHLYEFGLKSFQANSAAGNYQIAHHEYLACRTYLPRAIDFVVKPFMAATNTHMQLEIWLRKPSVE
jgi:2-polyprenyl-3-methyl-5-hydroxy-6-metoxy-1,4-benzoquinol methylase